MHQYDVARIYSVVLPTAGSPPNSSTPPATNPPPITRSNSSIPVGSRGLSRVCTLTSGRTPLGAPARALNLDAGGAAMLSTRVFHALQCGHWPCHLLLWPPHSVQAYAVFALTIVVGLASSV